MKMMRHVLVLFAGIGLLVAGCSSTSPEEARPFEMSDPDVAMVWGITIFQEEPCTGLSMAGGEISGDATFGDLGRLTISMSSAWDIDNLLEDDEKQFEPVSPAAPEDGPAAPVLGLGDYPYHFQFNPFTAECLPDGQSEVSATGDVVFVAANGDQLLGRVVGGETHRLDFVMEGDGIETFNIVEFSGGTGEFSGAMGSFVAHTIFRFDFTAEEFVMELIEVMPGATISTDSY